MDDTDLDIRRLVMNTVSSNAGDDPLGLKELGRIINEAHSGKGGLDNDRCT